MSNNIDDGIPLVRESVMVVMDANTNKSDAIDWALKNVVRPRDTLLVLGVLCESFASFNNNNTNTSTSSPSSSSSCFPLRFLTGNGISGIWERLEFSGPGELNSREIQKEFDEKRVEYQTNLQPFYRQCKKMEVKMDVKFSAGFPAGKLIVDEAHNSNARWIVLDSHFKKDKLYICRHINCNVALIKGSDVATLIPTKRILVTNCQVGDFPFGDFGTDLISSSASPPQSPCLQLYPLCWLKEFPRAFSHEEIRTITKEFSQENVIRDENDIMVYQGSLKESPVSVLCFKESDKRFSKMLKILTRIRHRNIVNLIGYCCAKDSISLLFDYPCKGTVAMNLLCDEAAEQLGWKTRWRIAQEIGACLRYLHEECIDGPIVLNSVCSSNVVFSHCFSAMLSNFTNAKRLKNDDSTGLNETSKGECLNGEDNGVCADIKGYGMFLLELISGKSACQFLQQGNGQTLIDWGLGLLNKGLVFEVMDSRLKKSADSKDTWMAHNMAHAALHCLQFHSTIPNKLHSINQAIGIVRGDDAHAT